MNILVTGGAGYIGSVLVPFLLDDKHGTHHVTVIDNFMFGQSSLALCAASRRFRAINGDVRDVKAMQPLIAWADVIIPLAAIVGAPACSKDMSAAMSVNRNAVQWLCRMASKDQRIIFPNTNSGYGTSDGQSECTEDTPLRPISLYGQMKTEAEKIVLDHENSVVFRLATVFGASPRMRIDLLVNDFTWRAMNDKSIVVFEGHFQRNFIHVRDVARVFGHAINHFDKMKGRPYNVGRSDSNMSKIELCEKLKKHFPEFVYFTSEIGVDPDKRNYSVSNKRVEDAGFLPLETVDDGIVELIRLYPMLRNNRYGNV